MARKVAKSRIEVVEKSAEDAADSMPVPSQEGKKSLKKGSGSLDDLATTALRAFLIARDAAFNMRDLITQSSRMAFLAIKECEKELDVIERYIDERLPAAITRVNEARARQLLTSLKCTTDLECRRGRRRWRLPMCANWWRCPPSCARCLTWYTADSWIWIWSVPGRSCKWIRTLTGFATLCSKNI
jgi:hypothetical protein